MATKELKIEKARFINAKEPATETYFI